MTTRVVQGLLLAAVAVALGWLVVDFGPEPLIAAITALVAFLTLCRAGPGKGQPAADPGGDRRLAVLPLQNITETEGREYFADGLTEELISVLSRVSGLRVIAKSSVLQYRQQDRPIAEIGSELQVGTVLEGSVRSVGDSLRVSVRLIDVASESHLWSADYDRRLQDVFAVQRDIATEVARSLEVSLVGTEAERIARAPTDDLEAYDLYLLGIHELDKRTEEGVLRSIERFRAAVSRDPDFAAAHGGIADAYVIATIGYANVPFPEAMQEARAASLRALEADETLSNAHTSHGFVLLNFDWDWAGAEARFKRALELNPSDARAYQWYAQYFLYQRRFEDGIPYAQRAQELDPRSALIATEVGWPFQYLGKNEEALAQFHRAIALDPSFPLSHFNVGNVLESEGKLEAALEKYEHAVELSGRAPMFLAFQARALALLGRRKDASDVLQDVTEAARAGAPASVYIAHVYDAMGEKEEVLAWLERARVGKEPMILAIGSRWLPFSSVKDTARFQELLSELPIDAGTGR